MDGIEIPQDVKNDVKEYIRVDDGLKEARLQMKESRAGLKECGERIIEFMKQSDMDKFYVKRGEQCLTLKETIHKVRPNSEQAQTKIQELLSQGISDPAKIWDEVLKCGGTKSVWKLSRRSKRKSSGKKRKPKKDALSSEDNNK